jgi:hypothetical protein
MKFLKCNFRFVTVIEHECVNDGNSIILKRNNHVLIKEITLTNGKYILIPLRHCAASWIH